MTSLFEILKASKTGLAPDLWTLLRGRKYAAQHSAQERELEGVPPLTFSANGDNLLLWSIYGNMQQTGTPTPDSPIYPSETGGRTENLFDKNGDILTGSGSVINVTETGIKTIVQTQGNNRYSAIKLDNELLGKTITVSSTITQSANNKGQIRLFYVNGRYATSSITAITTEGQTGHISTTYTMPSSIPSGSDGIAIVLSSDKGGNGEVGDYVDYADLMIVEGSTAPSSYIPYGYKLPVQCGGVTTPVYTAEPLRKIGDYTDYKSNSAEYRAIKKLVLTGQETSWTKASSAKVYYLWQYDDDALNSANIISCMCSHYSAQGNVTTVSGVENLKCCFRTTAQTLYIHDDAFESKADFVTYLQQQYANGTPVTVWYVLATPTTTQVQAPEIPTTAGSNTFDVDTTLKPSKVYIKYKG